MRLGRKTAGKLPAPRAVHSHARFPPSLQSQSPCGVYHRHLHMHKDHGTRHSRFEACHEQFELDFRLRFVQLKYRAQLGAGGSWRSGMRVLWMCRGREGWHHSIEDMRPGTRNIGSLSSSVTMIMSVPACLRPGRVQKPRMWEL